MDERKRLLQALEVQEGLRGTVPDDVVDATVAVLRDRLAALDARPADQQRRLVTVLFADLHGFTALSETRDAEDVAALMNDLWERVDRVIVEHGGELDKHIGDAVMAVWGGNVAREDDAERVVRAALAAHDAVAGWSTERVLAVAMRIGVNTGPALLGAVGSNDEYTAMGDAVNVASRLEHASPVGSVLISQETYRQVRGVFDVEMQAPLRVKGKSEPLQTYRVIKVKPRAF